jgi:mono/diheme cytochrome c family protein
MKRSFFQRHSSLTIMVPALAALVLPACFGGEDDEYFGLPYYPGGSEILVSEVPPPAISGGTLLVSKDGASAVAADPDRDRIWIVDLNERAVRGEIALEAGDEPGRVAEDGAGRAHVALRRGGKLVTVDIAAAKVVEARDVCAAPRGVAYDAKADAVHVACAGGELVTLPAGGGAATKVLKLDRDLRDVVVDGDKLLVSRFKTAELLVIDADGVVADRKTLPAFEPSAQPGQTFVPAVAWRTVGVPGGGVLMTHQRAFTGLVPLSLPGGYYSGIGGDGSVLHSAMSLIKSPTGAPSASETQPADAIPFVSLPVDVAVSANGAEAAMVAAGTNVLVRYELDRIESEAGNLGYSPSIVQQQVFGQPIAVAAHPSGGFIVQTREPAKLMLPGDSEGIFLTKESRKDTGHDMFHTPPSGFGSVSCASCHPEGHEDGLVWNFDTVGERRTQTIGMAGGISQTAPFHWSGDLNDMSSLMGEVFGTRMGGVAVGPRRLKVFTAWIDTLREIPSAPPIDVQAVTRGKEIFHDAKVACGKCHTGAALTDNKSADVGTGEVLQVPTLLGVAARAPFMHDGCAATLRDRFDSACGGGDKHGVTSHLTQAQIDDLIAYLETL